MLKLLEKAIKKSLIRIIDLEFAKLLSPNNENVILLVSTYLSYSNSIGHTCLPISFFEKNIFFPTLESKLKNKIIEKISHIKNWKQELFKYDICSTGITDTPIIIDNNYIYLYKNWKIENKIIRFIKKNNQNIDTNIINIENFKKISKYKLSKQNKIAIGLILIKKIIFIIGGPGTGKTSIIKHILKVLTKIYNIKLKIKIVALTGKATNRIIDILKNNTIYLDKISNKTIQINTIHHLLGINRNTKKPYFCKKNPLFTDIIIVDESSMIDIFIMNKLIDAVLKKTKIIFLGDINQLPAIENGTVLKDICYSANNQFNEQTAKLIKKITNYHVQINHDKYMNINDCIYILKTQHRFHKTSQINIMSQAILNNDLKFLSKVIQNKYNNIIFFDIENINKYNEMINIITLKYIKLLKKFLKNPNIINSTDLLNKYKTLCIIKNGIFGVKKINQDIEKKIFEYIKIKKYYINHEYWYLGKPIIFKKNKKILNLLNGDIGITTKNKKNELQVSFLSSNQNITNIPIDLLHKKEYDTAWSITVHKSQGSEFENIILILPNTINNLLNKEILYTAITRAKKKIIIFSKKKILFKTFFNQMIKYSGIKEMI